MILSDCPPSSDPIDYNVLVKCYRVMTRNYFDKCPVLYFVRNDDAASNVN